MIVAELMVMMMVMMMMMVMTVLVMLTCKDVDTGRHSTLSHCL